MMDSTTAQLAILKTKKRLYSDEWFLPICLIAILGLYPVFTFAMRAVSLSWEFGTVDAEIPLVSVPLNDRSLHRYSDKPAAMITSTTSTVVLTTEALFFGNIGSFTKSFVDPNSKIQINHVNGTPQIDVFMKDMARWIDSNKKDEKSNESFCVLISSGEIPAAIVAQLIFRLRQSQLFERIVLANGII